MKSRKERIRPVGDGRDAGMVQDQGGGEALKSKSRNAARNKAWKELSARLRADAGKCEKCGEADGLCCHHIIEKRVWPSLWLEEKDLVVLCRRCHFKVHGHQAAEFFAWLAERKPEQWEWVKAKAREADSRQTRPMPGGRSKI